MKWSRTHTLVAGLALIVGVNAVVLAGVAFNRSGEPESNMRLSERELQVPFVWRDGIDNSGMSLHLNWRMLSPELPNDKQNASHYFAYRGGAEWLNAAKMAALGFEPPHANDPLNDRRRRERELSRDVLLVLEFDGAAYQATLARAMKLDASVAENAKVLKREQEASSRLFVVDAGLDKVALRAKYPDRERFAIMRGQVRPMWAADQKSNAPAGYVSQVSVDALNVPLALRSVFDGARLMGFDEAKNVVRYDVDVAFGRQLLPWIRGATRKSP